MSGPPVALVTGAALRLGAGIVRRLHGSGYSVAVHYRSSSAAATALTDELNGLRPGSADLVAGDIAQEGGPEALAVDVMARWGGCDVLVNNASAFFPTPMGEVTAADWDALVGSNLRGPFFLVQALLPTLRERCGVVVNLIDIHAERPLPDYPVYSMAKAGLAMMTRALARDLAPEVRVNGVAPGAILWPEDPDDAWGSQRASILERIPLGRTGESQDIADAVAYLVGAPYVTGQILAVDGGRSVVL